MAWEESNKLVTASPAPDAADSQPSGSIEARRNSGLLQVLDVFEPTTSGSNAESSSTGKSLSTDSPDPGHISEKPMEGKELSEEQKWALNAPPSNPVEDAGWKPSPSNGLNGSPRIIIVGAETSQAGDSDRLQNSADGGQANGGAEEEDLLAATSPKPSVLQKAMSGDPKAAKNSSGGTTNMSGRATEPTPDTDAEDSMKKGKGVSSVKGSGSPTSVRGNGSPMRGTQGQSSEHWSKLKSAFSNQEESSSHSHKKIEGSVKFDAMKFISELSTSRNKIAPVGGSMSKRGDRGKRSVKPILKQTKQDSEQGDSHNLDSTHSTKDLSLAVSQARQMLQPKKSVSFDLSSSRRRWTWRLPAIRAETDPWIQLWSYLFIVPLGYETWAFPFRLALGEPGLPWLWVTDSACDLWFILDAIVHCFVEIPGKPGLKRFHLAYLYMKRVFPLQLLPSIVFFFLSTEGTPLWLYWLAGLPRLVPRLRRLLDYFKNMEMNLDVDVDKLQIIKFTLTIFLSCHWVGCIYYWIARLLDFEDNTWVGQFEATMPNVFYRDSSPPGEHYVALLYRGWIGLAPNSYRKPPQNWPEQLFSVLVMFMAMYLSAYLIGTVMPYIIKRDPVAEADAKRRADFAAFANQRGLPADLVLKVQSYFDFQTSKASEKSGELEIQLTRSLEVKVAKKKFFSYIERCAVKGQPLFKCETTFLNSLATALKEIFLMPGEEFIRAGDVARELYFVADGACQLVENGNVLKEIRGDVPDMACMVGEASFFLGIPQVQAVRTREDGDVRLLVLTREASDKLFSQYPEQQELILRNILATWSLDMRGDDLGGGHEEEKEGGVEDESRTMIITNLKRREREAFASLSFAASIGDTEEVRRLIRRGADVNMTDYDGRGVLHQACKDGNIRIVEILLENGADKNAKSRWGTTPVMEAVYARQSSAVHTLLNVKAEMLVDDASSLLCDWASKGDIENLRLLLSNGIDPNQGDYDGRLPLHLASSEGHDKVVELLLMHSADVNVRDRWGGTPLKDAVVSGHPGVAALLRSRGGILPKGVGASEFCSAASSGDVGRLRMLHSCGVNPNEGDYDLRSPLHLACAEARLLVVSFLLGVSARVSARDRWGGSPLDDCVRGGTLYHKLCGRLILGWGGELGILRDTPEGEQALKEISEIKMDRVSDLIERLIASGLYEQKRKTLSDQDLLVCKEATLRVIIKNGEYERQLSEIFERFDLVSDELDGIGHKIKKLMHTISRLEDNQPGPTMHAIMNEPDQGSGMTMQSRRLSMNLSKGGRSQEEPKGNQGTKVQQLQNFFDSLNDEALDAEVILDDQLDEEQLKLYEELDQILLQQERMEGMGASGRAAVAKGLNRHLMQLFEVEEALNHLEDLVHSANCKLAEEDLPVPHGPSLIGQEALQAVLEALGVDHLQPEDLREMIFEAMDHSTSDKEIEAVTMHGLLCRSSAFRHVLNSLAGGDVDGYEVMFALLSKCSTIKEMPYSVIRRAAETCEVQTIPKGAMIISQGTRPAFMHIVKSGGFQAETEDANAETVTILGKFKEEAVIGSFEFYTGDLIPYSVVALQDSDIISISRQDVIAAFEHHPRVAEKVAAALLREAQACRAVAPYRSLNFVKRFGSKSPDMDMSDAQTKVVTAISAEFSITVDPEDPVAMGDLVLLQDLRPGIRVVIDSWDLFSYGAYSIDKSYFDGIDTFLGEVGTGFIVNIFNVLAKKEEINIGHWWECWIRYLADSSNLKLPDNKKDNDIGEGESFVVLTRAEKLHSVSERRTFRKLLLSSSLAPKYEASYLVTIGNLADPLPANQYREFLGNMLPGQTIGRVHQHVFLELFGKDGATTKFLTWPIIRKTLVENSSEERVEKEKFLMPGTTVFNPMSNSMQAWFFIIRGVACYHFLAVPARLTYKPFKSIYTVEILCTDLIFDLLMLVHVLVSFNIAFLNKKSRWQTKREKIARKYLSSGFYVDLISAFPLDWLQILMGMEIEVAEWTRLLKMLFIRVVLVGFAYSRSKPKGMFRIIMMAFMALHCSACVWSGLGLSPHLPFMLNTSWLEAESAQSFISGVEKGRGLTMWELYCISLNWVATHTVSAIGNTTLYPKNYVEVLFALVQLTVGMTFYKMKLSQISSFVMKAHGKVIKVRAELRSLVDYINTNKLSDDKHLTNEIRQHFFALQNMQRVDMNEVFDNVNHSLVFEMARLLCRESLDNSELFKGCSPKLLDRLSIILREVQFAPEEEVFQTGDVADEMFLVVSGQLEKFNVDPTGQESSVGKIKAGGSVGDVSFSFGMKHLFTVRAGAHSGATCLKLPRSGYLQVLKLYPEDKDTIAQNSLLSFEKAKVEHGSSKAGSKRGASVQNEDKDALVTQMLDGGEEKSIDSAEVLSDYLGEAETDFEKAIGTGIAAQISALKLRHVQGRMMQLLDAAKSNDVARILDLLKRGVNVGDCDPNKRTALHVASSEGHVSAITALIEQKADVNARDVNGNTPLNDAVREKRDEVAKHIRELVPGTQVQWEPAAAAVMMCDAAYQGDLSQLKRLLENGVSVNAADYDSRTPLHLSSCEGHSEVVQFLLARNAFVNARDRFSCTALQDAVRHGKTEVQKILKEAGGQVVGMETALTMCEAAATGDVATIKTFVENGVDAVIPDYDARTALHLAASNGQIEVLNYLLSQDISFNPVDIQGGTPFDDAVRHDQKIAAQMLELRGALRKGDPELELVQKQQEAVNFRHARLSRVPQVDLAVQTSEESTSEHLMKDFLQELFGSKQSLPEDACPSDAEEQGQEQDKETTVIITRKDKSLTAALEDWRVEQAKLHLLMDKISKILEKFLPENVQAFKGPAPVDGSNDAVKVRTVLPGAVNVLQRTKQENSGAQPGALLSSGGLGSPRQLAIVPRMVEGLDAIIERLTMLYRAIPVPDDGIAYCRVSFSKYNKMREAFLHKVLVTVALAQQLRHIVRHHQGGHH